MRFTLRRPAANRGWPAYLFWGRMRTSTFGLIVAFIVTAWLFETYKPPPPEPTAPEMTQVVPPGFVPDPDFTWVPRTSVRTYAPTTTRTTTPTTTTTTTPTTTPTAPTETTGTTEPPLPPGRDETAIPPASPTETTPQNPFMPSPPTPTTTPPAGPGPGPAPTPPAPVQ